MFEMRKNNVPHNICFLLKKLVEVISKLQCKIDTGEME